MKIVPITTKVRGNDGRIWHVPLHSKLLDCARCGTAMSASLVTLARGGGTLPLMRGRLPDIGGNMRPYCEECYDGVRINQ